MKKVLVFFANGMEECEALIVVDLLRRAKIEVVTFSLDENLDVKTSHSITVKADKTVEYADDDYDAIFLPGGLDGVSNLNSNHRVKDIIKNAYDNGALITAICAGPTVLSKLGLLSNKRATCYPTCSYELKKDGANYVDSSVVVDGRIITGRGLGASFEFAYEIIKFLIDKEKADEILKTICYFR